jgi:hypothetical protein
MNRKLLAIFLGTLILNAGTELHQLVRVPLLIQHYLHHRDEDSSISLIDFLKIHYTDSNHPDDNDDSEDNELPFKSTGNTSHIDTPVIAKKPAPAISFNLVGKPKGYHPEGIPNHLSFAVFHPPRFV